MRFFFYLLLLSAFVTADAQVATGVYNFGSFDNKGFDTINRANLNTHFSVPAYAKQGRGGFGLYYNLTFDSAIWTPYNNGSTTVWQPATGWGWTVDTDAVTGYFSYTTGQKKCFDNPPSWDWQIVSTNFLYVDNMGTSHAFAGTTSGCSTYGSPNIDVQATDGSGFTLSAGVNTFVIQDTSGKQITPPVNATGGVGSAVDRNGNKITTSASAIVDTTGSTALTITGSGTSSSPRVLTYPVWESSTSSSTTGTVTINYTNYNVMTAFGCSNVTEYSGTANLPTSIVLADGETYTFSYESTPGHAGSVTGRLSSATLPTGGIITYGYSGGSNGIVCADGGTATLTRTESSSAGTPTWTYSRTPGSTQATTHTDITDGMTPANHSSFDFVANPGADPTYKYYETNRLIYQGPASGTPLVSAQTCYNGTTGSCTTQVLTLPVTAIAQTTTLDGVSTSKVVDSYSTAGLITEEDVYDFGSSAPGSLLRKTTTSYANGLLGFPSKVLTSDSAGSTVSQITYSYDETTPTATSGLPNHVPVSGTRGNLTTTSQLINSGASLSATATYDDAGTLLTSTSPDGKTTYGYDSTDTFVTSMTMPTPASGVQMTTTASNDIPSGVLTSSTDVNGQTTTVKSYDSMLRPKEVDTPDGGKTVYVYDSPSQTDVQTYMTASTYADTRSTLDAYGRTSLVAVQKDASDWYETTYCYDADGNLQFQSYPALNQTGCSLPGDTYTYDVLGRTTKITHADGTYSSIKYVGRSQALTDESSVERISGTDGIGRKTTVCEISSNASMPGSGSPVSCGLDIAGTGFLTTYAYVAGQTTITQGVQTRVFKTDYLGRPTSVQEPESGMTTYTYSQNATGMVVTRTKPAANQTSSSVTTTTTTQYDALGRVLTISYSDGTPTKTYAYDTSAGWGQSQTNIKGRLSKASVPILGNSAITIYSYDAMGRTVLTGQCFPIDCSNSAAYKYITDSYDWAGNLTDQTDPTAGSIGNSYSAAGEITQITGNYALNGSSSGTTVNLVSSVQNGPNGPLNYESGNGLGISFSYDSLGRRNGGWVCSGSTQNYCTGGTQLYGYATSWTGSRLTGISDTILNKQITYGYDSFNRLTSQTVNSGVQQNFTYGYDRYGNRWQQNVTAGSGPQPQLSFNLSNNQIQTTGYSYDAAGNLRSDGAHNYSYDAEGNLTQVDAGSTANYAYDALNHRFRVQNASQTVDYTFDYLGRRVTTWQESSDFGIEGKMYWGTSSVPISFRNGPTYFEHQDWLGTERLRTNYAGATASTFTSLPFGDGYTASSTDADSYHYADLDRDSESTTDHAQFRQYSETAGRWMRPDPYLGSYDAGDPQSFNRYTYVANSPMSFVDPSGLLIQIGNCYYTGYGTGSFGSINTIELELEFCGGGDSGGGSSGGGGSGGGRGSGGGGAGSTGPSAPNNPQACVQSMANARALDYSQPLYNGMTTQQHIQSRHMSGVGKQNVSIYWTQNWSNIKKINYFTFLLGNPTYDSRGVTFEYTFPNFRAWLTPGSGLQNGIGYDKKGNDTLTNRLATLSDCKTVVTAYPIE